MERGAPARPARPQSTESLVTQAENFHFNPNIPFKHWTRAADTLHQEAHFALSDGDYGRAFIMLYRHSVLVMQLVSHPQFKEPESKKLFKPLSKRTNQVLDEMERIKPILDEDFAEWERMAGARDQPQPLPAPTSYDDYAARDPSLGGRARVLDPSENQELAVDLAQKELERRDRARRESRVPRGYRDEPDAGQHHAAAGRGQAPQSGYDGGDLQAQMEAVRRALSPSRRDVTRADDGIRHAEPRGAAPSHYSYPSISKSRAVQYERVQVDARAPPTMGPSRPPKELVPPQGRDWRSWPDGDGLTPAVPGKVPFDGQTSTLPPSAAGQLRLPPKTPLEGPPPLPRKNRIAFKPGAYLENGDPIRPVFIPHQLRSTFLKIAEKNTRAGLEMCGILCGTPVNNALFVRCLLIPDQKCTPDTCETENEGALFDYCASEDLLVLGWIHTHPTQTCFMSSRDLHTQAGYQVMMPESIAIVCAPRFSPSYGIFRLTHPPGLDHVLDCRHQDTFHQHSIDNIYRQTEHPNGHVYESDKLPFYVQDLRTK